jgi:hypothetical protein
MHCKSVCKISAQSDEQFWRYPLTSNKHVAKLSLEKTAFKHEILWASVPDQVMKTFICVLTSSMTAFIAFDLGN